MTSPLNGIRFISVYLGDACNFDCTYCDRGYIKSLGGQTMKHSDLPGVFKFFDWVWGQDHSDLDFILLHGGEPFLFVSRMEQILEHLAPQLRERGLKVTITTNGSMILDNKEFIIKWQDILNMNWSYDFNFQDLNRESLDVKEVADFVRTTKCGLYFQFVCPLNGINIDTAAEIVNTCKLTKVGKVNIIPLRHHRGAHKFKSFLEETDMSEFIRNFLPFIHTLYAHGLDISIDGIHEGVIDKHILDNHGKFILSPDGYIYPEFDFLEYKRDEYKIGKWNELVPVLYRSRPEDDILLKKCRTCESKSLCGIKYLYSMFCIEPGKKCKEFYKIIDISARHLNELKTKPSILHWVPPNVKT